LHPLANEGEDRGEGGLVAVKDRAIMEEDEMRLIYILLTFCLLAAPSMVRADEAAQSAKEGFKEVDAGMKKVTKSVAKKAKKDFKAIDAKAKKDLKTMDKNAKKAWKKADEDVKKAVKG
jgi:ElaB/YqjD/DUF883 family membrane-anchored ribosome-binding protein